MRSFKLEDYSELLAAIESPGLDLILVGGHAVSVYGYDYHRSCPALDAYLPFLSKDADLIGTVASGMQLASRLNAQWKKESTKGGLRGLSIGHIELPNVPGAKVEILGQILGVKTEDIRNTAVVKSFRGYQFKVINPLLLYEAKATNVVQIDQINPHPFVSAWLCTRLGFQLFPLAKTSPPFKPICQSRVFDPDILREPNSAHPVAVVLL